VLNYINQFFYILKRVEREVKSMEWYDIVTIIAGTIYIVGWGVSFVLNWRWLLSENENPKEKENILALVEFSSGWPYFGPQAIMDSISKRRLMKYLKKEEKLEKEKRNNEEWRNSTLGN